MLKSLCFKFTRMCPTLAKASLSHSYRLSSSLLCTCQLYAPLPPVRGEPGGGTRGDLLDLTLKTRQRGGAIDTPFVSTELSIWHAFLALDVHFFRSTMVICCSIA